MKHVKQNVKFVLTIIDKKNIANLEKINNFIYKYFFKKTNKKIYIKNLSLSDKKAIIDTYNCKFVKFYERKNNSEDIYNQKYNISVQTLIKKKILYCDIELDNIVISNTNNNLFINFKIKKIYYSNNIKNININIEEKKMTQK